jgi:hypothetical protein
LTNADSLCRDCSSLVSLPTITSTAVTNVKYAFQNCRVVNGGALALYNQLAGQSTPPSPHDNCFTDCGANTTTGAAELAQIPTDWGGTNYEEELG